MNELILQVCLTLAQAPSLAAFDVASEILNVEQAEVAKLCHLEPEYTKLYKSNEDFDKIVDRGTYDTTIYNLNRDGTR